MAKQYSLCVSFFNLLVSTHSMWETICDAQAGFCTHSSNSKFLSKFSRKPLSGISDQKAPPSPKWKTSDFRWPKFTPVYTPQNEKFQIWDDQTLLWNTPQKWKTSDLRWPKFIPEYPPFPKMKNFRFDMTKLYSRILPQNEKLQIWDDQSLLWNTPPKWKTLDFRWPKFTPEYPSPLKMKNLAKVYSGIPPFPKMKNFRFEMTKVYSGIPPKMKNFRFEMTKVYSRIAPKNEKLQIWDDQSLLQNTPPSKWKTSDLRWPNFTLEYPPPQNEKLQIWDDQSLLWNTPLPKMKNFRFEMTKLYSGIPPHKMKNFRFEMTKLYSRIPPPPKWKTSDLRWPKFTPEYIPQMKNFRFEMTKVYSRIPQYTPVGLRSWRSYVETNLYPPWIPLVLFSVEWLMRKRTLESFQKLYHYKVWVLH